MASRTNARGNGRKPGQSAREVQEALAGANPVKTVVTRFLGIPTAEQAWGTGAEGEEHVGRLLNKLRKAGWLVMHDLEISHTGRNVDHLAIGPTGVFVIETKKLSGEVRVNGPSIKVNGYSQDYVENLKEQARLVHELLNQRLEWDNLWVQGLLVFVEPELKVKAQPGVVWVVTDEELLPTLRNWDRRLTQNQMNAIAHAAQAIW